ncbi:MAG: DUF2298 domain-containing protein, partial [Chloroflexota bacterium]
AGASLIRAYNPEITGTEKPMDFAFLNALYRTEVLPPEDPWMSGHSISYYYFGYLLLAVLAKLSNVPASVGYNLGVAVVFALLLAGSFSLSFNLISLLRPHWRLFSRLLGALLAPLMVGLMGNMEVGLEILALRGIGDTAFWQWVGVKGIAASAQPEGWIPTSHWWWWRASRIIPTIKPDGINEFPYFSFLLGDLHPHYSSLPWALLAIALSLAALIRGRIEASSLLPRKLVKDWVWLITPAICLGFLLVGNSWDFPSYTGLFWLASLVGAFYYPHPDPLPKGEGVDMHQHRVGAVSWTRLVAPTVRQLLIISALSVLLYLPFFLGFSSQTKGIGVSGDKTPLASMLIIFGPFLLILAVFFSWQYLSPVVGKRRDGVVSDAGNSGFASSNRTGKTGIYIFAVGLAVFSWFAGAFALILGLMMLAGAVAIRMIGSSPEEGREGETVAQRFIVLLALLGLILVFVPEFVFIIDLFGTRMNTVFKFHYQAWLLLGISSSVAVLWLLSSAPGVLRWLTAIGAVLLVCVGLLYPLAATPAKANGFKAPPTLDGAAFYQTVRPDDYSAIRWLSNSVTGRPVIAEAVGGEYSEYARVSTFSGLPTILGWPGHEVQWRGKGEEAQRRSLDVEAIYRTATDTELMELLHRYRVEYLFVGSLEIERYGPAVTSRFEGILEPVHRQGKVVIYKVQVPEWR